MIKKCDKHNALGNHMTSPVPASCRYIFIDIVRVETLDIRYKGANV